MDAHYQDQDIWSKSNRARKQKPGIRKYSFSPTDPLYSKKIGKRRIYRDDAQTTVWGDESIRRYEQRALRGGSNNPSLDYASKTPFPTYSQFRKPQMIDLQSRQYRWADGSDYEGFKERNGSNVASNLEDISLDKMSSSKDALLYLRFTKNTRQRIGFPEVGSDITFFDLKKKILFTGRVESVDGVYPVTSATGSVQISNVRYTGSFDKSKDLQGPVRTALLQLPKKYQISLK